jgi:hypothetical protein
LLPFLIMHAVFWLSVKKVTELFLTKCLKLSILKYDC